MLTERIKKLFNFIDFLHSNINNFNLYSETIQEWRRVCWKQSTLGHNYKEVLEKRALQEIIDAKWDELHTNIIDPIEHEGLYNVYVYYDGKTPNLNDVYFDLLGIDKYFKDEHLEGIQKAKIQYLRFRNGVTNNIYTIPKLKLLFEKLDILMSHIIEPFSDEGDEILPEITITPIETILSLPESLNLPLTDVQTRDLYDKLIMENRAVICKDTNFDHFSYAFVGKQIPDSKLPFQPIKLAVKVDAIYIELVSLLKESQLMDTDNSTIPRKYQDICNKLFVNTRGNPLILRKQ